MDTVYQGPVVTENDTVRWRVTIYRSDGTYAVYDGTIMNWPEGGGKLLLYAWRVA
jgi:hypothetical protein